MASTWGVSWGSNWGVSWDGTPTPPATGPAIDRGGIGLSRDRIKELRRAAKREQEAREKSYATKKSERDELRTALESAWRDAKKAGPKTETAFVEALPSVDLKADAVDWQPVVRDHSAVLRLISTLQKRVVAEKKEAEQAKKADDKAREAKEAAAARAAKLREAERQAVIAAEQAEQMRIMQDDELMAVFLLAA